MLPQRVSDPLGTSESRSSHSIQSLSWGAHEDTVRSGGDQHGE